MSFSISVSLPHLPLPVPDDLGYLDAWLDAMQQYVLYQEPLGADSTVYHYWSSIASLLELPMLSAMYDHGLEVQDLAALSQLERELDQLAQYWQTHALEEPPPPSAIRHVLHEHLQERMQYVRHAIHLARGHNAILSIS